jgi:NAD(P)-dependent dehydrogenase (short-subunit alcohol dehydrogenase family)
LAESVVVITGGGRGIGAETARLGSPFEYIDYAASKGAIDTMTLGLSKEVAADGIRVVAVRPGLIDTEIHASGGDPDRVERLRDRIPAARGGRPEEVAQAIVWLLSDEASYTTGAILDVAGGR